MWVVARPGLSHVSLDSVQIAELPSVPVFVTSWPDVGRSRPAAHLALGFGPAAEPGGSPQGCAPPPNRQCALQSTRVMAGSACVCRCERASVCARIWEQARACACEGLEVCVGVRGWETEHMKACERRTKCVRT